MGEEEKVVRLSKGELLDVLTNKDKTVGVVKVDNEELDEKGYQSTTVKLERIHEALKFLRSLDSMVDAELYKGVTIHVVSNGVPLLSTKKLSEQGVYVGIAPVEDDTDATL